jgi:cytochrome c biogenesis protein CcdA
MNEPKPAPPSTSRIAPRRTAAQTVRAYLGIILVLSVAGTILAIPFAYQAIFGLVQGGGTGTPVDAFEFTDQTGKTRSTEQFRGSVVALHFFYPKETNPNGGSTTPVVFNNATLRQLDAFAALEEKYSPGKAMVDERCSGDRCVNLLTIIVPRVCCVSRPLPAFFAGDTYFNYELAKVTWPVARDSELNAFKECGAWIKNDNLDLGNLQRLYDTPLKGDSAVVVLDKEMRLATFWNTFAEAALLADLIDTLLDDRPVDPQFRYSASQVNVATLMALLIFLGAVSLLSPCCLGVAVASVSSILQIQKSAGPALRREDSLLVGLAFSLGMAAVFFVIGLAVASVGLFIQGNFFLIGTSAILIALGLMAFGVHKPLADRYYRWKWEREERKHSHAAHGGKEAKPIALEGAGAAAAGSSSSGPKMGEPGCPHCAKVAANGGEDPKMQEARTGRTAGAAALVSGAVFGAVGIPCAAIFILSAIALVASQTVPLLVGGAFLFAFGFARGVLTVPLAVGANAVSKSQGGLAKWIVKHRRHMNWAFGISLFAFAGYLLVRLLAPQAIPF